MKISIRAKLLLASLSLLVVPWLGYKYVQGLESYLRSAQEQQLLDRVGIMAAVISGHQTAFFSHPAPENVAAGQSHIYARPLRSPIQVDGYPDDWNLYADRREFLGSGNSAQDLEVHYSLGVWQGSLYIFIAVRDDHIVYRRPNSQHTDRSDHLRIGIQDRNGAYQRYRLSTTSPGWVNAYFMPDKERIGLPQGSESRIKAEWQEVSGGYDIELRIPDTMIGDRLAFAVVDVDDAQSRSVEEIVGNGDTEQREGLGTIALPTADMQQLLQRLLQPLSRIWLVDSAYRVMALADNMAADEMPDDPNLVAPRAAGVSSGDFVRFFYRMLLDQPAHTIKDHLSSASHFDDAAVIQATAGQPAVSRRRTSDEKVSIITAAHPLYVDGRVVGALALEETSNSILIMQNQAIEALMNMSLLALVLTVGILLAFATRLSVRVRHLRDQVDASISADGRIQGGVKFTGAGDELGDLGRSFHAMHERLAQYNRYLETMAGKLGHELRTPITIVRSSLENLESEQSEAERRLYLQRAHDGVARLNGILTRMSEATHLEQTIQQETAKPFIPDEVVAACVAGYRLAHPRLQFSYVCDTSASNARVNGSAELLAQLLDKLVSNALDFVKPNTTIQIALAHENNRLALSVANEGPRLPKEMRTNLFESMVSLRQGKSDGPHLGLGLYIVRLIAEYHRGHVEVSDLVDRDGVVFRVILPLS